MKRTIRLLSAALALTLTLPLSARAEIAAEKLGDYLYFLRLDDYVRKTVSDAAPTGMTGGCTCVRSGHLFGRNLDLTYSSVPEFVVHLSGTEDRLESIGVCADPYITTVVDEMTQDELLSMPNICNDGINEKGVAVSVNVVMPGDASDLLGTAPDKEPLWAPYVVRYLLDRAESAEHAAALLRDVNIVGGFEGYNLHWMIADADDTIIAEIQNGSLIISRNEYSFMTNFAMTLGPTQEKQVAAGREFTDLPLLNDYAIGVERYALVREHYAEGATEEGMLSLMKSVRATETYRSLPGNRWYTEFTGVGLPISASAEAFEAEFEEQCRRYENRDRLNPQGDWITWHTSVYNLAELSLAVYSQEEYGEAYRFRLNAADGIGTGDGE